MCSYMFQNYLNNKLHNLCININIIIIIIIIRVEWTATISSRRNVKLLLKINLP